MRFSPGQTIGHYAIEALLGEGGMGEVYRARDSRLDRNVALKVLRNSGDADGADWNHAVLRMQREAKAVAALSHANIVAIYDVGVHDGSPYIAMELVSGRSVRDLIGTNLTLSRKLHILLDVARALEAAHEADIMHRDIKPDNILVRDDGTAKVLDFGIARRTSQGPEPSNIVDGIGQPLDAMQTADGALAGTPGYMAPEQLRGEQVDAQVDQFAWGVVAYELISGAHPFHAEKGAAKVISAILAETPEPLSDVPPEIATIILRALEKQPHERWPSMDEIVLQLVKVVATDEALRNSAVSRTSSSVTFIAVPTTPTRSWVKQLLPLALVALLALVLGIELANRRDLHALTAHHTLPVHSASAAPGPIVLTDLPLPHSTSLEAQAAFRQGLQAMRDGRWGTAGKDFDRARKLDPGMAAAHLRYAGIQFYTHLSESRQAFRSAIGLRTSLSERDQRLLHALEPLIQSDPSDFATMAQRFEVLTAIYPDDAEFYFWHAHALLKMGSSAALQQAVDVAKQCTKLDPKHADCWQAQAWSMMQQGRLDEADQALNQCVGAVDHAIDCLQDKIHLEARRGHCSAVVDALRQLTAMDPTTALPREMLAHALFFVDAPPKAVQLASEDAARSFQDAGLVHDAARLSVFADTVYGDFEKAIQKTNTAVSSTDTLAAKPEILLASLRIELRRQIGDLKGAATLADDFLIKTAIRPIASNTAILLDPTMRMHAIRLKTGMLSKREFEETRSKWLHEHSTKSPFERMLRWFEVYGLPAMVHRDLAPEALTTVDQMVENTSDTSFPFITLLLSIRGQLLVDTGKPAEALPYLEKGTLVCLDEGEASLTYMETIAYLGIARELTGDKPGACQSYQRVLNHWGSSKSSLTAKDVAKRAKALRCDITKTKQ